MSDLYGYSKVGRFFQMYKLGEEKDLFDYGIKYGWPYWVLRSLLWKIAEQNHIQFDASTPAIINYAKREGLWELRGRSILARKSKRKFIRQDRSFSVDLYRELI